MPDDNENGRGIDSTGNTGSRRAEDADRSDLPQKAAPEKVGNPQRAGSGERPRSSERSSNRDTRERDGGRGPSRSADRRGGDETRQERAPAAESLDVLIKKIRDRGEQADARLKGHLAGNIVLDIRDTRKKFEFPWGPTGSIEQPDCTISVNESSLRRLITGELNPQIGMVSDKIQVTGKVELAMYFFNIVAR